MKKARHIFTMALVLVLLLSNTVSALAVETHSNKSSTEAISFVYKGDIEIIITEESADNLVILREYHDGILVDTLRYKPDSYPEVADFSSNARSNPYLSNSTALGSVYYNVQGYSNQIRMDLRYKFDGSPKQTTYTIKNRYASLLALSTDIGAALFMPAALTATIAQKLVSWGILKVVTSGIERVSSSTLSSSAQNEYLYAYVPEQAPDQAEVSKIFSGTTYTINETNSVYTGEIFYSGYTSAGWGTTAMGANLGNNFFVNYSSVARWVK